jgi:hypothetical protein
MATHHKIDSQEVRKRAAEIRRHWSPSERVQRTGLPPDIPARLKEFILGPAREWGLATSRSEKVCHPFRPF